MAAANLAHRHAGFIRLAQNLNFLLRRKSLILSCAHPLRSVCGPVTQQIEVSHFSPSILFQKSLKLHSGCFVIFTVYRMLSQY